MYLFLNRITNYTSKKKEASRKGASFTACFQTSRRYVRWVSAATDSRTNQQTGAIVEIHNESLGVPFKIHMIRNLKTAPTCIIS